MTAGGRLLPWLPALVVAGAALALFGSIFTRDMSADLEAHVDMARASVLTGSYPGNFLYYLLVAATTWFSDDLRLLRAAATALLALAVAAKFVLSWSLLREHIVGPGGTPDRTLDVAVTAAAVALLLAFSLPTSMIYLGQITPNVWHNSTTIFLMPFALGLFWTSQRYLLDPQPRWLWWSLGVGLCATAVKPSFTLVFVIVFPLAATVRFPLRSRDLVRAWVAAATLTLAILAQYVYIYVAEPPGSEDSGVTLAPFSVWDAYSTSIPLSMLASFAFPAVALAVYRRALWTTPVRYALAMTAVAVAMFALLSETGPRALDGNFSWQAVVCTYILFLVVAANVLRLWYVKPRLRWGDLITAAALSAHVVAGVAFLIHYVQTGAYS